MEKKVLRVLKKIIDPELGINIVDLGLIYKIDINDNKVLILMTLTSPFCPYGPALISAVKKKVKSLDGTKSVKIKLTFTPAWNESKISKEAKLRLG